MGIFSRILTKLTGSAGVSTEDWNELERDLISADIGAKTSKAIIQRAREFSGESAQSRLSQALTSSLSQKDRNLAEHGIVLIVGVNGTGKTTSAAKLAFRLHGLKRAVLLAAADTFRAAAVEQLMTWGKRIDVEVITGRGDTASVAFDATTAYLEKKADYLIVDTAGRLHTKNDLIDELGKVKRVIEKREKLAEVLLVLDATTGQNGLAQAKVFTEAVEVTGLIVTKLDGTARGGIALSIESELDIPIKFVGSGEDVDDFAPFDSQEYIASLLA